MDVAELKVLDTWVLNPRVFNDDRGLFFEWFQEDTYLQHSSTKFEIAQANCSVSGQNVLRGLHFADLPAGQRKYVTCFSGAALDVVVDVRRGSPTFLQWDFIELNTVSKRAVSIPNGVAHGFLALEPNTTVVYLCDKRYNPKSERELNAFDPEIGINWPKDIEFLMSEKDKNAPFLNNIEFDLPSFIEKQH